MEEDDDIYSPMESNNQGLATLFLSSSNSIGSYDSVNLTSSTTTDDRNMNDSDVIPNIKSARSSNSPHTSKSPVPSKVKNHHSKGSDADEIMIFGDLTFRMSELDLLCDTIMKQLDEVVALEAMKSKVKGLDWNAITSIMNASLNNKRDAREYRRIWKYIAYGELYASSTITYPDSDEDNYYYQPMTAIARFDAKAYMKMKKQKSWDLSNTSSTSPNTIINASSSSETDIKEDISSPSISTPLIRTLRRQRHTKHPCKKVKLIISNTHAEETVPSAVLICSNERYLQPLKYEPKQTNSRGSYTAALVLIGQLLDRKKPVAPVNPALLKKHTATATMVTNSTSSSASSSNKRPIAMPGNSSIKEAIGAMQKKAKPSMSSNSTMPYNDSGASIVNMNNLLLASNTLTPTTRVAVHSSSSASMDASNQTKPNKSDYPPWQLPAPR